MRINMYYLDYGGITFDGAYKRFQRESTTDPLKVINIETIIKDDEEHFKYTIRVWYR